MIIYKILNRKTNKIYIGQTLRELSVRRAEHLRSAQQLERQKHPTPLHTAIREDGSGSFEWEILEVCNSFEHMNERERFYIKLLNTLVPRGYNQTVGGHMDGNLSQDIRDKIAASMSAIHKDESYQQAVYPKLKGLVPPNKGVPMTPEQKIKVSEAGKARYQVPGYVNPNVGSKRTEQQKANIKAGQSGNMVSGEAWHVAHKDQYTPEVRAKMRDAKVGKKPANTKKVRCVETGEIFAGLTEASKALDINRQSIWMQIRGKIKSAGGKHFQYIEE